MNSKHVTPAQLRTLQEKALPILRTAKQFVGCSDADIIEHVLTPGYTKKNWIADSWLNCVVTSFAKNVSIEPSQESREWSGMEGGHILWDERAAKQIAIKLAADCGIALK